MLNWGGGILNTTYKSDVNTSNFDHSGSASIGFDWGIKLGYQHYFTQSQGLRAYVNYGMAHAYPESSSTNLGSDNSKNTTYNTAQRITANVDYLFDFVNAESSSFGLFGGIFVGYHEYAYTSEGRNTYNYRYTYFSGGVGFGFNVGLAATLANHHRIEFGAKIPVVGPSKKIDSNSDYNIKYASVNVGYSFVF